MNQPLLYMPNVLGLAPYAPYGKRQRLLDHVQGVLSDYANHLPLTVRQIYYRLVATHSEYPKEQRFYRQLVDTLARARRGGLIDFSAIRDDGVTSRYCGSGYDGLDQFKRSLTASARYYTRDRAEGQPKQVFLLCEAAGMVPQLVRACGDYPVRVRSSGGMDGVTAKYDLARLCADRPSVVLHVGDFDPTGLSIFHQLALDVPAMIRDYCRANLEPVPVYECKRVAVLEEHVSAYSLLTGKAKTSDETKAWYPGIAGNPSATCEAEAYPPEVLMRIVREAVEAELDHEALARIEAIEKEERDLAVTALSGLDWAGAQ